jgi:putative salt-induced outer membrane protein YdiY
MFLMVLALLGRAADSELKTTVKDEKEAEKPEGKLGSELGGALAQGNTAAYNLSFGLTGSYKWKNNKVSGFAAALYGQSVVDGDGNGILSEVERDAGYVTSQRQLNSELRYDRFVSKKNSFYFLAGALVDPFAGFQSRSHEQIGYSRVLIDKDDTDLVSEIGFDWAQELYVDGVEPGYQNVFAARVMLGFEHTFNEAVSFKDQLEVFPNVVVLEDVRIMNSASLTAKLSDKLGFKTGYGLRFDNLPVEGFRKADHALTASLVVTFL